MQSSAAWCESGQLGLVLVGGEDVRAFAAAEGAVVEFERVAVTEAQVRTYHLPTAPATGWNRHCWTAAAFPEADVLVFGHSHIHWDSVTDTGLRLLNPGSPTDRRRQPEHTYLTAYVRSGELSEVTLRRVPGR